MVWLRLRSEWRRRRASLLALTLLVALVGSVVLATVAGSRRTRSSMERLDEVTRSVSATAVLAGDSLVLADDVLAMPEVEVGDRAYTVFVVPPDGYLPTAVSVDGQLGQTLQRDRVVRGRRARPTSPYEITLSEPLAARFELDVGGTLPIFLPDRRYVSCLFGEAPEEDAACVELDAFLSQQPPDSSRIEGEEVELEVVGVTRGIGDVAARSDDLVLLLLTPAFRDAHADADLQPAVFVRLRDGVTIEQFERALQDVVPNDAFADFFESSGVLAALDSTVSVLANGLLAFGAVAALAGVVAVAQAMARQAAVSAEERVALRSLGATRRTRAIDALAPLTIVAVAGAVLSLTGAWLLSPIMPIGIARRAEPAPGFLFDAPVLLLGGLSVALIVLGAAAIAAAWVVRRSPAGAARPWAFRGLSGSVPAAVGTRFALGRRRADRAVPMRSAMVGVAFAVAGVVAVGTFGAALTRLGDEARRYGYGWDVSISGGTVDDPARDDPAVSAQEDAQRIAADPDVQGVSRLWLGYRTRVAGRSVGAYAQRTYAGSAGFVIVDGRAPIGTGEVALGAKTLQHAGVGIGEIVDVEGRRLRVVGQALFPTTDDGYALADGALLSEADLIEFGALSENQGFTTMAVTLRRGADRERAFDRLQRLNRDEPVTLARVPAEVGQLEQIDQLPVVLAVFLSVVALLAVGHALVLTVRRRVGDLAVLRVIGCTPAQTRRTVAWLATTLALVGAIVGLPAGLFVGRAVWARIAHAYGVADDPAWPWLTVVFAVPVTLLLANLMAWWPGWRAARLRPAEALRTE